MTPSPGCVDNTLLRQYCQDALRKIDTILAEPLKQQRQAPDFGLRDMIRLRDCLIERVRSGREQPGIQAALRQVNTAISMVVAVEYPEAGLKPEWLAEARDILKGLSI